MTALVVLHVGDVAVDLTGWGFLILCSVAAWIGSDR